MSLVLPATSLAAAASGLIALTLAARVSRARFRARISLGDGSTGATPGREAEATALYAACRSFANFAEYAPLTLILIGLTEAGGAPVWLSATLAGGFVLGRLMHPIGMTRPSPNPFRAGGILLQWLVLLGASAAILVRAAA